MVNLVLFGPPGSGKGTQSVKIAEKYKLVHISTGDVFRREIRAKSELGLKVQSIIEKGELVSDDLLIQILENEIKKYPDAQGFVFDGFPRTIRQAEDLDKLMAKMGEKLTVVLSLTVNDNEILQRLLKRAEIEGRKDDTREVIENRISVYNAQTQPLIDFYKAKGILTDVEGIGSIDEIFSHLCAVIDAH
ncbi:MAG: adenylate kinase [Bacteroidales bacterium]|nr:adenylate kinase [Bacteroidales bacterium]